MTAFSACVLTSSYRSIFGPQKSNLLSLLKNLFGLGIFLPAMQPGPARFFCPGRAASLLTRSGDSPVGLPAAGGRRIGRWTCRRAAQPAGRVGGRPRRLVGLEVLRLLELILGRRDLQLVGSVVLALHDLEGGGRDGHKIAPDGATKKIIC